MRRCPHPARQAQQGTKSPPLAGIPQSGFQSNVTPRTQGQGKKSPRRGGPDTEDGNEEGLSEEDLIFAEHKDKLSAGARSLFQGVLNAEVPKDDDGIVLVMAGMAEIIDSLVFTAQPRFFDGANTRLKTSAPDPATGDPPKSVFDTNKNELYTQTFHRRDVKVWIPPFKGERKQQVLKRLHYIAWILTVLCTKFRNDHKNVVEGTISTRLLIGEGINLSHGVRSLQAVIEGALDDRRSESVSVGVGSVIDNSAAITNVSNYLDEMIRGRNVSRSPPNMRKP